MYVCKCKSVIVMTLFVYMVNKFQVLSLLGVSRHWVPVWLNQSQLEMQKLYLIWDCTKVIKWIPSHTNSSHIKQHYPALSECDMSGTAAFTVVPSSATEDGGLEDEQWPFGGQLLLVLFAATCSIVLTARVACLLDVLCVCFPVSRCGVNLKFWYNSMLFVQLSSSPFVVIHLALRMLQHCVPSTLASIQAVWAAIITLKIYTV